MIPPDVPIVDKTNGRSNAYAPPGWMFDLVRRYPQAAIVDVFHDPAQPASAVLEPMASGSQWFLLFVAGCFLGLAVWGALG